jgi:hypothetical protein
MRKLSASSGIVSVLLLFAGGSAFGQLYHGDIVYSRDDAGSGKFNAVYKLSGGTGDPIVVSQPGVRGNGPDFGSLIGGMAVDSGYNILLLGFDANAIFKIDPATGDRSILSGPGVGTGPQLAGANDLGLSLYLDRIFVSAGTAHSIIEVSPFTGDRTLVTGPGRGNGPVLEHPVGLTRTLAGDFYAFDADTEAVFFVEAATGDRRIVSGAGAGSGPEFSGFGSDVVLLPDGTLAVSDHGRRLLRVDPTTGARSILTGEGVGTGPNPNSMEYVTLLANGLLLATSATDGLILVDPATGDRSWVTGSEDAWINGGVFREGLQANPEPSGIVMGFGGLVAKLLGRGRRGRA